MVNVLEEGAEALKDQLRDFASSKVTYRSGPSSSVEVDATIGRTIFEVFSASNVVQRTESKDFIFPVVQLDFGSGVVEPKRGDLVEFARDGRTDIFQVMAPGDEPDWRFADVYRKQYRVHTKHTRTV